MQLEKSKICTKVHVKNRKTSDEVSRSGNKLFLVLKLLRKGTVNR